jgi:hypothetical protein
MTMKGCDDVSPVEWQPGQGEDAMMLLTERSE